MTTTSGDGMTRTLHLHLEGERAHLGEVAAVDVAKLIVAVERVVADAAALIVGRQPGLTGRKGRSVEVATRFRLAAVNEGSVSPVLLLPEPPAITGINLDDVRLGDLALDMALETLSEAHVEPAIATALARVGDEVGIGTKYDRVTFEDYRGTDRRGSYPLDRERCLRLRDTARQMTATRDDVIVGTLFEADFEKMTAQVRLSNKRPVAVNFDESLADQIQEVLRRRTELVGHVTFDERTGEIRRIDVDAVLQTEQRLLSLEGEPDFWEHRTVAQMIAERDTPPAGRQSELRDADASDEEINAFFEAVGLS